MDTVDLMFDGVLKTCVRQEDRNGEHLFVADDGRFVKFPADADLVKSIALHNEVNSDKVEIIPDVEYGEVITFDSKGEEIK